MGRRESFLVKSQTTGGEEGREVVGVVRVVLGVGVKVVREVVKEEVVG